MLGHKNLTEFGQIESILMHKDAAKAEPPLYSTYPV
jgi:hypothetical protein